MQVSIDWFTFLQWALLQQGVRMQDWHVRTTPDAAPSPWSMLCGLPAVRFRQPPGMPRADDAAEGFCGQCLGVFYVTVLTERLVANRFWPNGKEVSVNPSFFAMFLTIVVKTIHENAINFSVMHCLNEPLILKDQHVGIHANEPIILGKPLAFQG